MTTNEFAGNLPHIKAMYLYTVLFWMDNEASIQLSIAAEDIWAATKIAENLQMKGRPVKIEERNGEVYVQDWHDWKEIHGLDK